MEAKKKFSKYLVDDPTLQEAEELMEKTMQKDLKNIEYKTKDIVLMQGKGKKGKLIDFLEFITPRTRRNLSLLAINLNIEWLDIYRFRLKQLIGVIGTCPTCGTVHTTQRYRYVWSSLIRGTDKFRNEWTYWRKETSRRTSGQTLLYKNGRFPSQVSRFTNTRLYQKELSRLEALENKGETRGRTPNQVIADV
jgi:hypothetical protein